MIRHIVLIKFKPEVSEDTINGIFSDLHGVKNHVSGIGDIVAGRSQSPEQIERGYMHGFTIDMDDWNALQAYQDHPAHKAVGAQLVENALGGIDGILVVDIEV